MVLNYSGKVFKLRRLASITAHLLILGTSLCCIIGGQKSLIRSKFGGMISSPGPQNYSLCELGDAVIHCLTQIEHKRCNFM